MPSDSLRLRVDIELEPDADSAELDAATVELRRELLELDLDQVERPRGEPPPPGTRAGDATVLGTLVITAAPLAIGAVLRTLESWLVRRPSRSVKLEVDGDSIEISDASSEDQRRLIDSFLARHQDLSS
jgi:hypothetical protein